MNNNSLSIHTESGEIFYQNYKTGENFCNFLFAQQNYETAYVPKKIKHTQKVKNYIGLQKIEERNKQFLLEKLIHAVEFANPFEITFC